MTRKQTNRPTFLRFSLAYDKAKLLDLLSNWRCCSFLSTQRNIVFDRSWPKRDSRCFNFTFLVTFEENGLRLKDKHNIVGIRSLNFFGILRTQELVRLANFLENVLKRNMEGKLIKVACSAQLNSRHCWTDKKREFFLFGVLYQLVHRLFSK